MTKQDQQCNTILTASKLLNPFARYNFGGVTIDFIRLHQNNDRGCPAPVVEDRRSPDEISVNTLS